MTEKPLISGIVAEFNPLHLGHRYLIRQAKQSSPGGLAIVMSGNFVQRGEPAVFYKWPRALAALRCGADLVLELPVSFSVAGAERFAFGAVSVLNALGCVDRLVFGSESGDVKALFFIAETLLSPAFQAAVKNRLAFGVPFAAARQAAARELLGDPAALLQEPNNILGIEYCKALLRTHSSMRPQTVKRIGAPHDAQSFAPQTQIASASQIRQRLLQNESFASYVPEEVYPIFQRELLAGRAPASLSALETALLARLRSMSREELSLLPDISEGLENRIYSSIRTSASLEQLLISIKSKRYSHARIRRILLSAFLGLNQRELPETPAYLRVLAFNETGREMLRVMRHTASLPIVTNAGDFTRLGGGARAMFETECSTTDLYSLCTPEKGPCGLEMTCAYWERKDFFGNSNQGNGIPELRPVRTYQQRHHRSNGDD
ncbi:nucleotidyltransferase [Faecalispora sporosphaeroides]|uniref:nucleotidyltransferase n=1 Tax=Faecalispora sporosphaeroides TaxID=1549 RepID=UPI0003628979|nr:nucleotidyltransferase [Faecalispora sporosphaeroides]